MDEAENIVLHSHSAVATLEKILDTLNHMDGRLRLIETNTKVVDEESSCIHRKTDEAVLVCVRVNISSVSDIDTVAQEFTCEFFLAATWEEPQLRGQFDATRVDWSKNWDPRIYFANAVEIKSLHKKHKIIRMVANPTPVVQLSYRVVGRFKTLFSLHNFPFDYQTLKIEISSKWSSAAVVFDRTPNIPCVLSNENFLGKEQWDLLNHVITKDSSSSEDPSRVSIIKYSFYAFEFHIKRKYTYFLTNIVFMMFLISLLSFTTFFVKPENIGDRLSVILTLLLTAVTFKFVVSQSLPPVSYLTVLDWYVLSSVIFIFSVAIENSIVARIKRKSYRAIFDRGAWSASIVLFILMHLYFVVKVVYVLRDVRRALAYHQRCYQWKNGIFPVCEKLVSAALPRTFLSPPSQTSMMTDPSTPEDPVSNTVNNISCKEKKVRTFDRKAGFITSIDISPEVASQTASPQQEYVYSYWNRFSEELVIPEPNGRDKIEEHVLTAAKAKELNDRVEHYVTEDNVEADCAVVKSDGSSKRPDKQNGSDSTDMPPSTSNSRNSQRRIKHGSLSSGSIIEKSSIGARHGILPHLAERQEKGEESDATNVTKGFVRESQQKMGYIARRAVSTSLLKNVTTQAEFGKPNFSHLTTIKEDQVVNFEPKIPSHATFLPPRNTITHEALGKDTESNGLESSGSDLSDSEVEVPIPKTESDINASLFAGRNIRLNREIHG